MPCHEPVTSFRLSDLQRCGPRCTSRHTKPVSPPAQNPVQHFVFSVATTSQRLGRPARLFRDPLNSFPSLVPRIYVREPYERCAAPTSSQGRVALRPSIAVDFLSHRSVSCSCSQQRWPGSVMTRSPVPLVARTPSSVATELPISPSTAAVRGQFVDSLLRMENVAGSADTNMDSVTLAPRP